MQEQPDSRSSEGCAIYALIRHAPSHQTIFGHLVGYISSCWVELHCSKLPIGSAPHLTRNVLTCHRVSGRQEISSTQQGFARNLGPAKAPILDTPARTSALPNFDGGAAAAGESAPDLVVVCGSSLEGCRCSGGKLQLRRHSRCLSLDQSILNVIRLVRQLSS